MYQNAWATEGHHFLDSYALTCYKSIERAVDEILQDKGSLLSKDGQAKVQFWSTDVLRLAHVNMRILSILRRAVRDLSSGRGRGSQDPAQRLRVHLGRQYVAPRTSRAHHLLYAWFRQSARTL